MADRMHRGRHGDKNDGWVKLGPVGNAEGVVWLMFAKKQPSDSGWIYAKLVADGSVRHKANYWLSWNGERFASGGDYVKLIDHRKDILDMAKAFMAKNGPEQDQFGNFYL